MVYENFEKGKVGLEKMYNHQNDSYQVGFVVFIALFFIMLVSSIGTIIYLLVILKNKFTYVYECYAKMKLNELELEKIINNHCMNLFRVHKFNEKKLINEYLDHEV